MTFEDFLSEHVELGTVFANPIVRSAARELIAVALRELAAGLSCVADYLDPQTQ